MKLENDLRRALRPESPAPGFAADVMRRIEAEKERRPAPRRWMRAVAASLLLTALIGGWGAQQIQERREGERAKEQLLLAMRIAGEKAYHAREAVRAVGIDK